MSIQVDLVEGHGEQYWPRPGRIFAAARNHTFKQLADAIDDAFARWDRSHLQEFTLTGQTRLCRPDRDWEIEGEITEDYQRVKLSRLQPGEQFVSRRQPLFSGHSRMLRCAASRMSCASMRARDSAMPNAGHSQTNSSGPAGGSGQVHHREMKECGPPPAAKGYSTGPAGWASWSGLPPPGN